MAVHHLVVTGPDQMRDQRRLEGTRWLIGRKGSTGRPVPEGYRKIDLDLRENISREQARVEVDGDRLIVQRIGKAGVTISGKDVLGEGEERVIPLGDPFYIDDYEITISR